jgi:hypothetical protein
MIRRSVGVLGLGIGIWLVACSGSSSTGGSGSPEAACDGFVSTFCNKLNECLPFAIKAAYKDANECISRQKSQCVKSVNAPSSGLTAAYLDACTSSYSASSCDDILKPSDACKTVAGSLADGAPCGEDTQCTGRACNKTGDSNCGACAQRVGAGADCTNAKCDDGLTCAQNSKCVAPAAAGASCGETQPCQTPNVCSKGTCGPGAAAGASCADGEACNAFKGLICDPTSKTCKEVKVANAGEKCGLVDGQFVLCAAGGTCKSGTCAAPLADGASCTADGDGCQEPAECLNGVCTISDPGACK